MPPKAAAQQEQIIKGRLDAVGSVMVIKTSRGEELELPMDEKAQLTRNGQPFNWLDLHANVYVTITVQDNKITKMDLNS
ncbi:MAG: hypothetical protein ACM3XM_17030 [Mycobacterium leprae]